MEGVVLHGVGIPGLFWPKQGHSFKLSATPPYTNMGQVPPPPPRHIYKGRGRTKELKGKRQRKLRLPLFQFNCSKTNHNNGFAFSPMWL